MRTAGPANSRAQRGRLDRITNPRARTVQLDILNVRRPYTRAVVREPNDLLLRAGTRNRQTLAYPIVVDSTTTNHAIHMVTIDQRLPQRLQDNNRATLTAHEPVGPLIKCETAAIRRQRPEPRQLNSRLRAEMKNNPADNRADTLTTTQTLTRKMNSNQ